MNKEQEKAWREKASEFYSHPPLKGVFFAGAESFQQRAIKEFERALESIENALNDETNHDMVGAEYIVNTVEMNTLKEVIEIIKNLKP